MRKFFLILAVLGLAIALPFSLGLNKHPLELITLFPLDHYNQNLNAWIKESDPDYESPLLNPEMQQQHMSAFTKHYYGILSPWDAHYVSQIMHKTTPDDLKTIELNIIGNFSNIHKPDKALGYGENFRLHSPQWLNHLVSNIPVFQLDQLSYQAKQRAILIDNTAARALPSNEVHFYSHKLAGQGYPFDNLQMSALWAGTPIYVLAESKDHAWALVLAPELIAWIKTNSFAYVSESFVHSWTSAAEKNLAAMIQSETSIVDESGKFRFSAYVGAIFPAEEKASQIKILVPIADADHQALIKTALLSPETAALMPLHTTPHQFKRVMNTLIGRPYGWGGLYFYNDCSAELKNLLTPFGIWLPRHSSDQVYVGKVEDQSSSSAEQRLSYLLENGHRFLTLVYIGGHIFMYLGSYPDEAQGKAKVALTYQNLWALEPKPAKRRAVVGKAVLLPLLLQYPEDKSLNSLANKQFFQVSYLDQLPNYRLKLEAIDPRILMGMR